MSPRRPKKPVGGTVGGTVIVPEILVNKASVTLLEAAAGTAPPVVVNPPTLVASSVTFAPSDSYTPTAGGSTFTITPTIRDQFNAVMNGVSGTWSSGNAAVASVTQAGNVATVTPKVAGQAVLTFTVTRTNLAALTPTVQVGVSAVVTPPPPPPVSALGVPAAFNAPLQQWYNAPSNRMFLEADGVTLRDQHPGAIWPVGVQGPRELMNTTEPTGGVYGPATMPQGSPNLITNAATWTSVLQALNATGGTAYLSDAFVTAAVSGLVQINAPTRSGGPNAPVIIIRPQTEFTPGGLRRYPTAGVRVTPEWESRMPVIHSSFSAAPALGFADGAHGYRFIGIRFAPHPQFPSLQYQTPIGAMPGPKPGEFMYNLITINRAHNVMFDRVLVDTKPDQGVACLRGIFYYWTYRAAVLDSWIDGGDHYGGGDSQSVDFFLGPGPVKLVNTYCSGSSEAWAFGGRGGEPQEPYIEDVEVRLNHGHLPPQRLRNHPAYGAAARTIGPARNVVSVGFNGDNTELVVNVGPGVLPAYRGDDEQCAFILRVMNGPAATSFYFVSFWDAASGTLYCPLNLTGRNFLGLDGCPGYFADRSGQVFAGVGDSVQLCWRHSFRAKIPGGQVKSGNYMFWQGNIGEGGNGMGENQYNALSFKDQQYERAANVVCTDQALLDVWGGIATTDASRNSPDQVDGPVRKIAVSNAFILHCDRSLRGWNDRSFPYQPFSWNGRRCAFELWANDTSIREVTQARMPGAAKSDIEGICSWVANRVLPGIKIERVLGARGYGGMYVRASELHKTLALHTSGAVWKDNAVYEEPNTQASGNQRWPNGIGSEDAGMTTPRVSNDQPGDVYVNPTNDPSNWDWSVKPGSRHKNVTFSDGTTGDDGCNWVRMKAMLDFVRASPAHAPYSWKV